MTTPIVLTDLRRLERRVIRQSRIVLRWQQRLQEAETLLDVLRADLRQHAETYAAQCAP